VGALVPQPELFCDESGEPLSGEFDHVTFPMLFLPADDDSMAPPASVEALRKCYPNASTCVNLLKSADFDGSAIGHFDYLRNPAFASDWKVRLRELSKSIQTGPSTATSAII
jgi:predicted alpha/beta hydrolase